MTHRSQISTSPSANSGPTAFLRSMTVPYIYVMAIVAAEMTMIGDGVICGAVIHAILIPVLLSHYALVDQVPYRRMLPPLALVPLMRIISLTASPATVLPIYWHLLIGVPLLIAAGLTLRLLALSRDDLGLYPRSWRPQLLIALTGLPLSLIAFHFTRPDPLFATITGANLAIGAFILTAFSAFAEELVFRGVLQHACHETIGGAAVFWVNILFATSYLGSLSPAYVLLMGMSGLFFSWSVARTNSIWGVVLSHSVLKIGMLLVWPYLIK